MNNKTKKFDSDKIQLWVLLGPIVLFTLILWFVGFWAQPATGDLTRISHYTDRYYGWNEPQAALVVPREIIKTSNFNRESGWPVQGDILIFGDSFADPLPTALSWIDLIKAQSGQSIQVVKYRGFDQILQYLRSNEFARKPPKAVIVQSVERYLRERALGVYDSSKDCLTDAGIPDKRSGWGSISISLQTRSVNRREAYGNVAEFFDRAIIFMRKALKPKESSVLLVDLKRTDLFSHSTPHKVLIYREDVSKHSLGSPSEGRLKNMQSQIVCGLSQILGFANTVAFKFVLVPDKLSVYGPWVKTELPPKDLPLNDLAFKALGGYLIDLKPAMQLAVNQGVLDLYLPNDSHWGTAGQRIAAEEVIRAFQSK